jgi:hypothetical protein
MWRRNPHSFAKFITNHQPMEGLALTIRNYLESGALDEPEANTPHCAGAALAIEEEEDGCKTKLHATTSLSSAPSMIVRLCTFAITHTLTNRWWFQVRKSKLNTMKIWKSTSAWNKPRLNGG